MKKRILAMLLAVAMVFSLLPMTALANESTVGTLTQTPESVAYLTWNSQQGKLVEATQKVYELVTDKTTTLSGSKWYVVKGEVTVKTRMFADGNVNLILCDGAHLMASEGISVIESKSSLTVYGQAEGTGVLTADATSTMHAGIGGMDGGGNNNCGTVTVNGGTVEAYGGGNNGLYSAGIGGAAGGYGSGGTVIVNGGRVIAGGYETSPGIGGGGNMGSLIINNPDIGIMAGTDPDNMTVMTATEYLTKKLLVIDIFYKNPIVFDSSMTNGTVTASPPSAFEGETVTLTITPAKGYRLIEESLKVTYGEDQPCELTEGAGMTVTFKMPAADSVTVTAQFEKLESIAYLDWDAAQGKLVDATLEDYALVTGSTTTLSGSVSEWYVVKDFAVFDGRVKVVGDVKLLICDGAVMVANSGITLSAGNSLTVYGQKKGEGILYATTNTGAAIGGASGAANCGSFTVNGCAVEAHGGNNSAGIGGYVNGSGGSVTVNAGAVMAYGGNNGAGIGGGSGKGGGSVTVNAGVVQAFGGNNGAGIGCGKNGIGGSVTVNGGSVLAEGGSNGVGIGGSGSFSVAVNGGSVKAYGYGKAAIGGVSTLTVNDSCMGILAGDDPSEMIKMSVSEYLEGTYPCISVVPNNSITVDSGMANGKVELSSVGALEGEAVTLTVVPAEGYLLKDDSLKVTYGDGQSCELIELDYNEFIFEMPPASVTVTAEFEEMTKADPLTLTVDGKEITFYGISKYSELKYFFAKGGNAYLVNDITVTDTDVSPENEFSLTVKEDVNLCLNSKVLDLNSCNILVSEGTDLGLYDNGDTVHYFNVDPETGLWIITDSVTENSVTGGFKTYNPDALVNTFFHYDGPGTNKTVLNASNELEVVTRDTTFWYVGADGEDVELKDAPKVITDKTGNDEWTDGILFVPAGQTVTIDGTVTLSENVSLILADGAGVEITKGITGDSKTLTVCGQTKGTGKLTVKGEDKTDDNGGNGVDTNLAVCGSSVEITGGSGINGGNGVTNSVTVSGSANVTVIGGSGITGSGGSGVSNGGAEVVVSGSAKLTVIGGNGGANGGSGIYASSVALNGGELTVTGGNATSGNFNGGNGVTGNVSITGGTATLTGGEGTGTGKGGKAVTGTVSAEGMNVSSTEPDGTAGGTTTVKHIPHTHSLTEVTVCSASCTEEGVKKAYWVCSGEDGCGKAFADSEGKTPISEEDIAKDYIIPATGHDFTGDPVSNGNGTHSFKCVNGDCTAVGTGSGENAVENGYVTCTCNQETDTTHQASPADCTNAATYYKTCACGYCDETATFAQGDPNGHSYDYAKADYQWQDDSCTATACCTACTEGTDGHTVTETATLANGKTAYVKDTDATCTAAETGHYTASFENTGFGTDSTEANSVTNGSPKGHSFATTYSKDATGHWYAATCGHDEKSGFAEHTWKSGKCSVCGYACVHQFGEPVETETEISKTCSICGITESESKNTDSDVNVSFDPKAFGAENPDDVEIKVVEMEENATEVKAIQENVIKGESKEALVFDVTALVNGEAIHELEAGYTAKVKIKIPDGYSNVEIYYINDQGETEFIESEVIGEYVYFEVTHFSAYAIVGEVKDDSDSGCIFGKIDFLHFRDWLTRFHRFLFMVDFMPDGFEMIGFFKYILEGLKIIFIW